MLLALLLSAVVVPACAPFGSEQLLLEQFFALSRIRDRTALQQISTVVFEPHVDGTVIYFTVASVALESDGRSKRVTVDAVVRPPDGATAKRRMVLALERRHDRWMVTGFAALSP